MTFEEELLKKEDVVGSNAIFFNGVVFEDVLLRLRVSHNLLVLLRLVRGGGPRLPRSPGSPQGGGSVSAVDLMP